LVVSRYQEAESLPVSYFIVPKKWKLVCLT